MHVIKTTQLTEKSGMTIRKIR